MNSSISGGMRNSQQMTRGGQNDSLQNSGMAPKSWKKMNNNRFRSSLPENPTMNYNQENIQFETGTHEFHPQDKSINE